MDGVSQGPCVAHQFRTSQLALSASLQRMHSPSAWSFTHNITMTWQTRGEQGVVVPWGDPVANGNWRGLMIWYDMMAAIALYDGDDETWCLGGWQERWRREVRPAVGGSIYMEDPYLSNLLTAKPARQRPQYLESRAKAYLCPSLTLYSLAAFQKLTGWGKLGGWRKRDECHQGWLVWGWSATEQEILNDGGSWCRSKGR